MSDPDYFTHAKALVDHGATIGAGTRIWAFAHVQADASIGKHCNICNYVFVESGARLGDRVTVKNGVQVWEGVTAENDVFLGPNCVLTNDLRPRSRQPAPALPTLICEGATIGAGAVVLCNLTIGRFAFVAAGSLVTGDVPAFAMVWGRPARFRYWISRAAVRLALTATTPEVVCPTSGYRYRLDGNQVTELPSTRK